MGYYLPPFAYGYMESVGDAVKGAGTLDQDKLTAYIHMPRSRRFLGEVRFGDDGDWTGVKIVFAQIYNVKRNDMAQFRGGKIEAILQPLGIRLGNLVELYSAIVH